MEKLTDFLCVVDNYNSLIEERRSISVLNFLKDAEDILMDILDTADALPSVNVKNADFEAISYHSYTIEFTISKIDDEEETDNIAKWRKLYKSLRKSFQGCFNYRLDDRQELRLVNIADTLATIFVKFAYIKDNFGSADDTLVWTYKYGYETDFGDDIVYLLEILPGFRELIRKEE